MRLDRFREAEGAPLVPLTPLVDVLFLLIIFLVLGANFDQVETVRLPRARGEVAAATAPVLRLALRADGTLWPADGPPGSAGPGNGPLDAAALRALVRARAPERVLLLPDERAPVGPLLRWHDLIGRELGVPVQVGVRPPER